MREAAPKAAAKNDETQIVTAVKAFYVEYGHFPIGASQTTKDAYYGPGPIQPSLSVTVVNMGSNALLIDVLRNNISGANASMVKSLNPREIVFLDAPIAKNVSHPKSCVVPDGFPNAGIYFDPWGSPYNILINASYSGTLPNPYADAPGGAILKTGVIAWSFGKNGILGGGPRLNNDFTSESGTSGSYYSKPGNTSTPSSGDVISWQ
ncbi:MAG: hypothetical protein WCD79_23340 [Chthoniobacteraceae bacterium]